MLKDRLINYTDTPSSIGLKIYDIIGIILEISTIGDDRARLISIKYNIDCGKVTTKTKQERIKIVNDDEDEPNGYKPPNLIRVIFQTEEGRKSRIKFSIMKVNILNHKMLFFHYVI